MRTPIAERWDEEYRAKGIPSSFRDDPSGVIEWVMKNWNFLGDSPGPKTILDVGCGTGRNAAFMAEQGSQVLGLDVSKEAIGAALRRLDAAGSLNLRFIVHDLVDGLPAESASIDLLTDVFVYKHQIQPEMRARYRREMMRVLRKDGRILLSLAHEDDGYYSSCPEDPATQAGNHRTIVDPVIGIGSVLFTPEALAAEMGEHFALEMMWDKVKFGPMHGSEHRRHTFATIWRLK